MMELKELDRESAAKWDSLIENYKGKRPFHNTAWLDFLEKSQNAKKRLFKIIDAGRTVGYFCGLEIKKGPFKIFGSPLEGWNTPHMGPLVSSDSDQKAVIGAIGDYFKENRFSVLEFSSEFLDDTVMRAEKFGRYIKYTSLINLSSRSEDELWNALSSNCRTRIRKARKDNLTVETAGEGDSTFIDEYYLQLKEVFKRRAMAAPYRKERVERLFDLLKGKDMLLALQVKKPDGETVASGIFIFDERYMFLFGMAGRTKYLHLSPYELLVWESIRTAKQKGIGTYDLGGLGGGGLGRFKNKFKGAKKEVVHWRRFFSLYAGIAYFIYKAVLLVRLRLLKWSL
jgi:predicted N-acyltransferase